jgi:WD40 repeat protein
MCLTVFPSNSDKPWLASASADKAVRLWDPEKNEACSAIEDKHKAGVSAIFFFQTASGKNRLVSGDADGEIFMHDTNDWKQCRAPGGHADSAIRSFATYADRDGTLFLASVGDDSLLKLSVQTRYTWARAVSRKASQYRALSVLASKIPPARRDSPRATKWAYIQDSYTGAFSRETRWLGKVFDSQN